MTHTRPTASPATVAEALALPVLLVAAWELSVRCSLFPPSLSAAPSAIVVNLVRLILQGTILKHALISTARLLLAVSFGTLAGTVSGLVIAQSTRADRFLSPTIQLLAPIPVVVWIPFVIMALGSGELYKMTLAFAATFFLVHLNVMNSAIRVHRDFMELAQIYEKSAWTRSWQILLPSSLPALLTALRLSLALAWVVLFFGEASTSKLGSEGLGWFITDARAVGRIEDEYAGVLLLAAIGSSADRLIGNLQRRLLAWSDILSPRESVE